MISAVGMIPNFTPDMGKDMLDAIAMDEGANEEMHRYEEKANYRIKV